MPLPLTVSCFSKIQIGFTFLVPANLGSPEKGPLNGCVCVCVHARVPGWRHSDWPLTCSLYYIILVYGLGYVSEHWPMLEWSSVQTNCGRHTLAG